MVVQIGEPVIGPVECSARTEYSQAVYGSSLSF